MLAAENRKHRTSRHRTRACKASGAPPIFPNIVNTAGNQEEYMCGPYDNWHLYYTNKNDNNFRTLPSNLSRFSKEGQAVRAIVPLKKL